MCLCGVAQALTKQLTDTVSLQADIQAAVASAWKQVSTENLSDISDFAGYQTEFLKLFGFGLDGVDYTAEATTVRDCSAST